LEGLLNPDPTGDAAFKAAAKADDLVMAAVVLLASAAKRLDDSIETVVGSTDPAVVLAKSLAVMVRDEMPDASESIKDVLKYLDLIP
jgi:hypothetical protein